MKIYPNIQKYDVYYLYEGEPPKLIMINFTKSELLEKKILRHINFHIVKHPDDGFGLSCKVTYGP
jgi:hypothetical protein